MRSIDQLARDPPITDRRHRLPDAAGGRASANDRSRRHVERLATVRCLPDNWPSRRPRGPYRCWPRRKVFAGVVHASVGSARDATRAGEHAARRQREAAGTLRADPAEANANGRGGVPGREPRRRCVASAPDAPPKRRPMVRTGPLPGAAASWRCTVGPSSPMRLADAGRAEQTPPARAGPGAGRARPAIDSHTAPKGRVPIGLSKPQARCPRDGRGRLERSPGRTAPGPGSRSHRKSRLDQVLRRRRFRGHVPLP
jgi:hypothetical protein